MITVLVSRTCNEWFYEAQEQLPLEMYKTFDWDDIQVLMIK